MDYTEVIISTSGPFALSVECRKKYTEYTGGKEVNLSDRTDSQLIRIVESLGKTASTSQLTIVKVPTYFKNALQIKQSGNCETVSINVNKAFADLLHSFMLGNMNESNFKTVYNEMLIISQGRMIHYNRN